MNALRFFILLNPQTGNFFCQYNLKTGYVTYPRVVDVASTFCIKRISKSLYHKTTTHHQVHSFCYLVAVNCTDEELHKKNRLSHFDLTDIINFWQSIKYCASLF